ncbi:DMT family transporter [Pararhodobacter sp.]|uniref:DMT family transporter n=1 Tax=Pararhodobacter sp. TaxID=2127056 RepID=UPI002AFE4C0F|nr:DMT family transporter [Pararhodobacter sp.]
MKRLFLAYAALFAIGTAWGSSMPLVKIAVGGGHVPTGIMAVQLGLTVVVVGAILGLSGRWRQIPLDAAHLRLYGVVGMIGMAIPHFASLTGTAHLPAGVMSIIMSLVPLFVLPLSLVLGLEGFRPRRLIGVLLGGVAIILLTAPEASLPAPGLWVWVLVGAVAPLFYALEGMYVSQTPARQAGPFVVLWMGSALALMIALPLAIVTGALHWPEDGLGVPELAIAGSGAVSVFGYAGYIALLRHTGPVFGAQVSYIVTGMGVVWAMLLLGERYSNWVWGALAVLFVGLFLVQPRRNPLDELRVETGDDGV